MTSAPSMSLMGQESLRPPAGSDELCQPWRSDHLRARKARSIPSEHVRGVVDTLLALVWTQYQYFLFPLIFGYFGVKLLLADWRHCHVEE